MSVQFARGLRRPWSHRAFLGLVLGIGGGAQGLERVVVLALGLEQECGRDLPLDVDLLRPIGILGLAQLVAQLGELGDVGLGGVRIAGAGRPQRAREMRQRLDL